jgi:hypothetical protein
MVEIVSAPPRALPAAEVEIADLDEAAAAPADAVPVLAEDDADALPDAAALQPDGSVVLTLHRPVTLRYRAPGAQAVQEDTRETLHFRRLTGADMRAITQAAAGDRAVLAIGRSAGIRPALMNLLFDRMDGADVAAAGDVVGFFLGSGRKTGR